MPETLRQKRCTPIFVQNTAWTIQHGFFGLWGGLSAKDHALLKTTPQNQCSDCALPYTPIADFLEKTHTLAGNTGGIDPLGLKGTSFHSLKIDTPPHDKNPFEANVAKDLCDICIAHRCVLIKKIGATSLAELDGDTVAWLPHQQHTNRVLILPKDQTQLLQPSDALITQNPDAIIGIITADCAPILVHDPVARVVGAIHAGWRGAVSGIIEKTIGQMMNLGCTFSNLRATIGPMIRKESYHVSDDFIQIIQDNSPWDIKPMTHSANNHVFFDLPLYVQKRLEPLVSGIHDVKIDTFTQTDFFSHRRASLYDQRNFSLFNPSKTAFQEHNPSEHNPSEHNPSEHKAFKGHKKEYDQNGVIGSLNRDAYTHGRNISWISLRSLE